MKTKITPLRCIVAICLCFGIAYFVMLSFLDGIKQNGNTNEFHQHDDISPFPDDSLHHIHWFVQVSDLHFSIFYDPLRAPDFQRFVTETIQGVIKPEAVVVTGDITDAKLEDKQGSEQFEEEWKMYSNILKETKVTESTAWLDIRGNHDAFSVPSLESKENMFRQYSHQGSKHNLRSYTHTHTSADGDSVSFIAVDACPDPGPRRPFNFFGVLTEGDMEQIEKLRRESAGSNTTVWFGHYPTSTVLSPHPGIRSLMSQSVYLSGHLHTMFNNVPNMYVLHPDESLMELELGDWRDYRVSGSVYLCGHLHSFGDFVFNMHTMQKSGHLELELADWKINRKFRIFAVDHGLFSFTDLSHEKWPVVLVTNPKHGQFNMPKYEPTGRMKHSTHIRILAFSKWRISSLKVKIDGREVGEGRHIKGPLYVIPWQPEVYSTGLHTLEVLTEDAGGNSNIVKQFFSLDNSRVHFELAPRFLLMFNHILLMKCLFFLALSVAVVPLIILRFCSVQVENFSVKSWSSQIARFIQTWIRRLHLVSKSNRVFFLMVSFAVYITIGPWFVGEVIKGHIGVCFVHGLYIQNVYIPGTLTYLYGFFQLITFNIPLTLYLGCVLDLRLSHHKQRDGEGPGSGRPLVYLVLYWIRDHGFFVLLISWQLYLAYSGFCLAYGGVAFLLSPVRTWAVGLAVYLRHTAINGDCSVKRDRLSSNSENNREVSS